VWNSGCSDTLIQELEIKSAPTADFNFSTPCVGTPITFTDESAYVGVWSITAWDWNINGVSGYNDEVVSYNHSAQDTFDVTLFVFSLNGCDAEVTKEIIVHEKPIARFENLHSCQSELHQFADSSSYVDGAIVEWDWLIEDYGIFSEQEPEFHTTDTGDYYSRLIVVDENYCRDTIIETLRVDMKPTVDFSFSPWFAIPDDEIEFTNYSTGVSVNTWYFGDGIDDLSWDATHAYSDSGVYDITLIGENYLGCSDTLVRSISIINPLYDVAVLSMTEEVIDNKLYVTALLASFSTVPLYNLELRIDFENGSSIYEYWTGELNMGEVINYTFTSVYEISDYTIPSYVCTEANIVGDFIDVNPDNNIMCNTDEATYLLLEPYPNPAVDQIMIEFILPYSDVVILDIYDSRGKMIDRAIIRETHEGLNRLIYNTSTLSDGVYNISFNFEGSIKTERFIKE